MWNDLYIKVKDWMADSRPERFIVQALQNQREMRSSYQGTYELVHLLKFLEMKAAEETSVANGDITCEGGIFSSICQLGGSHYE